MQLNMAGLRELGRVAEQVDQHLAQAQRVAHERERQVGADLVEQLQSLVVCQQTEGRDDLVEQVVQGKRGGLDLHLAGLEFGLVEDVVDRVQQVRRRLARRGLACVRAAGRPRFTV